MFILNPGQVHSCNSGNQLRQSYKIMSVSSQTMQSIASQISEKQEQNPYFKKIHHKDFGLTQKFLQLLEIIINSESNIEIENNLYQFLVFLIINYSECPPLKCEVGEQKDSIKRVCDYINQNYMETISLKKLASVTCLSPFHFQREFKRAIGITPHEYLTDLRIRRSKDTLINSNNIADAAIQLGFFDQSHFSKVFKKTVGVSPGNYLKINKRY